MPTYVFKCEKCENVFEESLKYEDRDSPTEHLCQKCDGNVIRIPAMPLFAYDNVGSKKPDNAAIQKYAPNIVEGTKKLVDWSKSL